LTDQESFSVNTRDSEASEGVDKFVATEAEEVTCGRIGIAGTAGAGIGAGCACALSTGFSRAQVAGWTARVDVGMNRGGGGVAVIGGVAGFAGGDTGVGVGAGAGEGVGGSA
jgi:hypothetical protein